VGQEDRANVLHAANAALPQQSRYQPKNRRPRRSVRRLTNKLRYPRVQALPQQSRYQPKNRPPRRSVRRLTNKLRHPRVQALPQQSRYQPKNRPPRRCSRQTLTFRRMTVRGLQRPTDGRRRPRLRGRPAPDAGAPEAQMAGPLRAARSQNEDGARCSSRFQFPRATRSPSRIRDATGLSGLNTPKVRAP
jgi:hypothetical protein